MTQRINGVLIRTAEVYCAGCEAFVGGLSNRTNDAASELRQQWGWAIRRGLWHCDECKDDPERIGARDR